MGIDRIGKGGGLPPTSGLGNEAGTSGVKGTGATFELERPGAIDGKTAQAASAVSGAGAVDASSPLGRLQRGEIDLDRYLDLKVEGATAKLQGLSADELASIKDMLRDQMATDPQLVELVRNATGQLPKPSEE